MNFLCHKSAPGSPFSIILDQSFAYSPLVALQLATGRQSDTFSENSYGNPIQKSGSWRGWCRGRGGWSLPVPPLIFRFSYRMFQCWQPTRMKRMNHPNNSFSSLSLGLLGWNLFCLLLTIFCYMFLCFFILEWWPCQHRELLVESCGSNPTLHNPLKVPI